MFYISKLIKKNNQIQKKNKKYGFLFIILILISIFLSIISKKSLIMSNTSLDTLTNKEICDHQGNDVLINVYGLRGQLKFKLTAHCIQHFSNKKITQFIRPNIIAFNKNNIPIWKITANKAKLSYEKKIYLYGDVYIKNLTNNIHFKSIITNYAIINLITQDIIATEKVIIHGHCFYSVGMKMHANLHKQTAKLIDNTQTYYEIQHTR